jgi:hypothetical protein
VALFLRREDFFRLADVDLATAFPFPTFADVVSGLFFFATIKFLQKLRFTAGSWISSGFVRAGLALTRVGVAATFN